MIKIIGNTLSVALICSICFFIGWIVGADEVLANCRNTGTTYFLNETISCTEWTP